MFTALPQPRRHETRRRDRGMRSAVLVALAAVVLTGCAVGLPAPPGGSAARAAECERAGGWWHAGVGDGFCEYQMQGGGSM